MMGYRDGQQSGFHGVTGPQRRAMEAQVTDLVDVCGLTERTGFSFGPPHWHSSGTGESQIVWDSRVFKGHDRGIIEVPTNRWTRGTDRNRTSVKFPWVLLEHIETTFALLASVVHVPAHRQSRAQREAGDVALRGAGRELAILQRELRPDRTTLRGDGNVDFRLQRNVDEFEHYLFPAGLKILVPPRPTIRGVFRRRIELWATTDRHGEGLEMMPWLPGYDHRGVKRLERTR